MLADHAQGCRAIRREAVQLCAEVIDPGAGCIPEEETRAEQQRAAEDVGRMEKGALPAGMRHGKQIAAVE